MLGAHSVDGLLIPINVTSQALVADGTHSITSTKTDIALHADCTNFTIKSSVVPTTPIFIKYGFGSAATATATDNDLVLVEGDSSYHLKVENKCTHLSIIAASGTQTVYVKQYKS